MSARIRRKLSSLTRPGLPVAACLSAACLTAASTGPRCSAVIVTPSSLHFRSMLSSPLFLPRTIRRSACTISAEYGSIASGRRNWLAPAPLSRMNKILAAQRLPRLKRVPRGPPHNLGNLSHLLEIHHHRYVVEAPRRECNLGDVGIARAFAHAVDRALYPGRSPADR